jgi:uncharacterized protein YciI
MNQHPTRRLFLLSLVLLFGVGSLRALTRPLYSDQDTPVTAPTSEHPANPRPTAPATTPVPPAPKYFLIVLKLVPRLHDEKAWTDADRASVGAHFNRLKAGVAAGQVLLAGRTEEPLDRTFGLIVFTAANEAAAREYMNGDPCVVAGTMTGELHPYGLALRAK